MVRSVPCLVVTRGPLRRGTSFDRVTELWRNTTVARQENPRNNNDRPAHRASCGLTEMCHAIYHLFNYAGGEAMIEWPQVHIFLHRTWFYEPRHGLRSAPGEEKKGLAGRGVTWTSRLGGLSYWKILEGCVAYHISS